MREGLAASDLLAAHLTLVLRSAGTTESVPVLIKLLKTSPTTVRDGTQSIENELKSYQASVTEVAVTSALWKLTGRKHIFTPDQWEKWWQSVKPDFVVPRERKLPEFVLSVTPERINALANDLAANEVAARERLIAIGPLALPHLLQVVAVTELLREPETAAQTDAALRRLAWVIDELGATDKLSAKLRREYFERRLSDSGTHVGSSPIDEDAFCRALSHCTFAEFCSICLAAPGRSDRHGPWGWMHMNSIVFSRRFGQQPGFVFGDPANFPLWNRVTPAAKPQQEIVDAVPVLVAALNHRDAEQREMATKLSDIVGLCSNEKPEALIVALRDRWLSEPEANVRVNIGSAMSRFASPIVNEAVLKGLRSQRLDILGDAAAFMDGASITLNDTTRPDFERLVELTRHENDRVRRCATRSLAYKAPQLLGPEYERLCTDKVKDIREACTLALRSNPDPKHADILFKLADDAEQTIRESAFSSIGNLKHPPSMKRLLPYLRDKKVHGYAVSALVDIGGEDALPLMMSELEAGNDVGGMVYQHLRRLTGEKLEDKPEPWLAWWKQKKLATLDERFPFLAKLSIPERDLPKGCVISKVELPLQGATNRRVTTDPRAFVLISEELTKPFKEHIKAAYYSVYREEGELGVFGWAFEDAAIAKDAHQRLMAEPSGRFRWWLSGRHVICLWRDRGVTDACFEAFEKFIEKRVADARAGRGSPDPALNLTAGLPNSDKETKTTNNANGDLRSNPAVGSGDPHPAQQPQSKESRALFQQWQRSARANGNIPGGTLGPLVRVMRNFVKNNPTHEGAPKFAELLKRIEVTRDWSRDEAVKLLDEVAAIYPSLPDWVQSENRFKLGGDVVAGKPLPEELKNAPWGEAAPNGLRVAWLLEPRALKYRLNTPLKSRILFHNAGKNSVVFRALTWNQSAEHKALDAQETEIHINSTYWTTIPMTFACRLAPGEFLEVIGAGIGVGANTDDEDWRDARRDVRVGSWIEAKAGDEVTFSPAAVHCDAREAGQPEGEEVATPENWWLKFISDRLSLDAPLPAAADERRRLLDRAVRDLFGKEPTPEEITAFTTDAAPDALDALAKRLANRAGFVPFSGSLKSGTRKFLVLPPDPDAAKKPRSAKGPGQYKLGGATFVVTRRPIGERIVNEAHLAFSQADATKPARKSHPVPLPDGYDSWIAAWMRVGMESQPTGGGTVLWVAQKGADKKESIRRYDFTNPESVKETVITDLKPSEDLPQAVLDALSPTSTRAKHREAPNE